MVGAHVAVMAITGQLALASAIDLSYYSRENCEALGYIPRWTDANYVPQTHFEKLFKTPLSIDLMAAAHSGNATGFEQVTADWGCDFAPSDEGFYGPGAKDPAGGGCPHGPVKVYEELACAIRLGLKDQPNAFLDFCDTSVDPKMGMFECVAFFANVLTETGDFADTEERDPRPYCWDRSGGGGCCPGTTKPCMADSDKELTAGEYPASNDLWLGTSDLPNKCCSYHGRGFLQVSYEPNYQALSKAMVGDETVLWYKPHLLDSDGVAGWTAALWFWFNEHPAQIANKENGAVESVSPRSEVYRWSEGRGFPGTINVINGGECDSSMLPERGLTRTSLMFAIAHRLGAVPPTAAGETPLPYYPLPGTADCEKSSWCRLQFHNNNSPCPTFNSHVSCVANMNAPYLVNASTPIGFNRVTIKTVQSDGQSPVCAFGATTAATPVEWLTPQQPFTPIENWWMMLDIDASNVCDLVSVRYSSDGYNFVEGNSNYCQSVCYHDFAQDPSEHGQPCEQPHMPCKTFADYVSHPMPADDWESGHMGNYHGGEFLGRVGPGMVMAMNEAFADHKDGLCYTFGASACHWNIAMGCLVEPPNDIHNCRVYPPGLSQAAVDQTIKDAVAPEGEKEPLAPGQFPADIREILSYYDISNCPDPDGSTPLEQLLPNGVYDIDFAFSGHYSQSDGFANARFDTFPDDQTVNMANELYGSGGPDFIWRRFYCAYRLGLPNDRDYFVKNLFLRESATSLSNVPKTLTEDQRRFGLLEFISMAANMIKETGGLSQAEEQDPRCYCNYQGGKENPCCPNEWGNNPPCSIPPEKHDITTEEMERGTGTDAQCCSYHGRGYLQSSYERNYGDLGALMFSNSRISEERGRQLLLNFPQAIDGFSVTGFVASMAFWLNPHPCQYCDGRNTTTVDWNAAEYSPHLAIVNYDIPGEGLGKTFTIINGQECEAAFTTEADVSQIGATDRLSLFYNLAYRFQVKAPGETTILPLPGTEECATSPWCQGTFAETAVPVASYRIHGGGCWALTPQPVGAKEVWPYCHIGNLATHTTKLGGHWTGPSFSLVRDSPGVCTHRHDFKCGYKAIDPYNRPSMYEDDDLIQYVTPVSPPKEYSDPMYAQYASWTAEDFCELVVDTNPGNTNPPANQDCKWWCLAPAGGMSCKSMQTTTCTINDKGLGFAACANTFFQTSVITSDCRIDLGGGNYPTQPPSDIPEVGGVDCSGKPDWKKGVTYPDPNGATVVHRDHLWVNQWWTTGEPGVVEDWKLLGTCGGAASNSKPTKPPGHNPPLQTQPPNNNPPPNNPPPAPSDPGNSNNNNSGNNNSSSGSPSSGGGKDCATADIWNPAANYPTTTYVTYNDALWHNSYYANAGQVPGSADSWIQDQGCNGNTRRCPCSGVAAWSASTVYDQNGSYATYGGKLYSNQYWSSNEQPDSSSNWLAVCTC